jgi:hypothetical protein
MTDVRQGERPPRVPGADLQLRTRLELIFEWYKGMVSEATGRLTYLYDPLAGTTVENGFPLRNIAAVGDVGGLSRFLGKPDLLPVVDASIRYHESAVIPSDVGLILDPVRLGEPSSIAHSGLLILALRYWDVPARDGLVRGLAAAIAHQQRPDGSLAVYFGGERDDGLEFYPGEALLALVEAWRMTGDPRFLAGAERGLAWSRDHFDRGRVDPDLLVFFANWQSRYAAILAAESERVDVRDRARSFVFALQDRVVGAGFYDGIDRHPLGQSTVQVACAVEGVVEACAVAADVRDADRVARYRGHARTALAWLADAQTVDEGTERECGGFGYSHTDRTQRIDVTGHVANGFRRSLEDGITT